MYTKISSETVKFIHPVYTKNYTTHLTRHYTLHKMHDLPERSHQQGERLFSVMFLRIRTTKPYCSTFS